MRAISHVGIRALGVYLPPEIRRNEWWPESTVAKWTEGRLAKSIRQEATERAPLTEGAQRVLEAIRQTNTDPFRGAVERRVAPQDMLASEMEVAAGRDAIARAQIDPGDIDLLLVHSTVPDYLNTNNACTVHRELGLSRRCLSMSVEAACNSFQLQIALAEQMIHGRRARHALLIQSSTLSRLLPYEQQYSAWFGDGATAVLVGPVEMGYGILGHAHRTDGRYANNLVSGVPGARWYDEGRSVLYWEDVAGAHDLLMAVADMAKDAVDEALRTSGMRPEQVDFYASHQGTCWLRRVTQEHLGLHRARSVDTFPWAGSLFGANIPLVLTTAERDGLLRKGDIVVAFSGGSGITWSSTVLRWGS